MDPLRVKRIGSVDYYSPNSVANAILNPYPSPENPFRPGIQPTIRYTELVTARPWSKFFGWTSFIPQDDCSRSSPGTFLTALAHPPPIETLRNEAGDIDGFRLTRNNQWRTLEQNVYLAVCTLRCAFHLPCVLPFLPHALGYNSTYSSEAQLRQSMKDSREWFLVWIGALSYCLYASEIYPDRLYRKPPYPRWRKALEDAGLSSAWVDQMIHSPIADYSSSVRRVGCIINLLHPEHGQPEVDWFLKAGVPVWYLWRDAEDREVEKRQELATYRPPRQIIPFQYIPGQGRHPSMEPIERLREESVDIGAAPGATVVQREPEWVAFFRGRDNNRSLIQAKEIPKQRQAREDRARNPPTRSAPVFEWNLSKKGDHSVWIRVPVPAGWRTEMLASYGANRTRYDPTFNEWDCCDAFEAATEDTGDVEADGHVRSKYGAQPPCAPPVSPGFPKPSNLAISNPISLPNDVSLPVLDSTPNLFLPNDPTGQEVEETFHLYYGYTPPPPATQISETKDPRRRDIFSRLLGLRDHRPEPARLAYLLSKPYLPVQYLVNSILDQTNDFRGVWDLRDDCIFPARCRCRFGMLRRFQGNPAPTNQALPCGDDLHDTADAFYVLEDSTSPVRWKLAFASASAAVTACRLPDDFTPFDIAIWMVQRGVPFRCFYPTPPIPRPLAQLARCFNIPVRPFDHIFTKEDYHSYVHLHTLILGQPHMQAAIRRGGIIWRLAIGTLGISKVLQLPSLWYRTRRITLGSAAYEEDGLTMNELDLICGAYECVSSMCSESYSRAPINNTPSRRQTEVTEVLVATCALL